MYLSLWQLAYCSNGSQLGVLTIVELRGIWARWKQIKSLFYGFLCPQMQIMIWIFFWNLNVIYSIVIPVVLMLYPCVILCSLLDLIRLKLILEIFWENRLYTINAITDECIWKKGRFICHHLLMMRPNINLSHVDSVRTWFLQICLRLIDHCSWSSTCAEIGLIHMLITVRQHYSCECTVTNYL